MFVRDIIQHGRDWTKCSLQRAFFLFVLILISDYLTNGYYYYLDAFRKISVKAFKHILVMPLY